MTPLSESSTSSASSRTMLSWYCAGATPETLPCATTALEYVRRWRGFCYISCKNLRGMRDTWTSVENSLMAALTWIENITWFVASDEQSRNDPVRSSAASSARQLTTDGDYA
jgi:hypothetical protein